MKLAFFDNYKLGVVVDDRIVDVSALTKGIKALGPQDVIRGVIEKWSTYKGKFAAAAKKGKGKPLSKVKLRSPLPRPENIICMAVNYMENGTLNEPAPINAFMKSPSAVFAPIATPADSSIALCATNAIADKRQGLSDAWIFITTLSRSRKTMSMGKVMRSLTV